MKIGSIVETVGDFEELRLMYGFPYPKKGDPLTIRSIEEHPNPDVRSRGIVLLYFEEIPDLVGVCDKSISGKPNFLELLLPDDIRNLLENPLEESIINVKTFN